MYSTEIQDGLDPEDDDPRKEKQQENTWNYLAQVGNYIEKGAEMIADGVSELIKKKSEVVIEEGPEALSEISTGITVVGYSAAVTGTFTATPTTGAVIIAGTNLITAPIDLTTVALQGIKTISDPSTDNFVDLGIYSVQGIGAYKIGKAAYKGIRSLNYIKFDLSPFSVGGLMGF